MINNLKLAMSRKRGFTLIELLVVIAIIGILAALIIVSLANSQKKASDTDRKTKAKSLNTALEQYFLDNAKYPYLAGTTDVGGGVDIQAGSSCTSVLQTALVSGGGAKKYLESSEACIDRDTTIFHHYKSLQDPATSKYYNIVVWQLKNQTETPINPSSSGNGVYRSTSSGLCGIGSTSCYYILGNVPAGGTRITITDLLPMADTNYFVTYGPQ